MKRLAIAVLVLALLVLLAGAAYYFLRSPNPKVGMQFSVPGQVMVGQRFAISITVSNYSDQIISNANLTLLLPEGVAFYGQDPGQRADTKSMGDLAPGSLVPQTFDLIALKDPQSIKKLNAKLAYSAGGSSAKYEDQSNFDLAVGQSAVSLSFSLPDQVYSGEDAEIKIDYANNSSQDLRNVQIRVDYPPVFQFKRSSADPSKGNNVWNLGTLAKGASGGNFTITGTLAGPPSSIYNFHAAITADFLGQDYTLTEQNASLAIASSPLAVAAVLNGEPDHVARIGEGETYTLSYSNNSEVPMSNVTIKAQLQGEVFDWSKLSTEGAFDSRTNTVTWNAANTPRLANLGPGEKGTVQVYVKLLDSFPIRRVSDRNYVLKLSAQIESPTVPSGTSAEKSVSLAKLENKVAGAADFSMAGYFRDAASGILNTGPYPPKVNSPTRYTIHWTIRNYSTDLTDAKVSAYLQSGTRFTGTAKSNAGTKPAYNPNSGQVTWDIGSIGATQGVLTKPLEAVFQVENTPAINQVGQAIELIGDAKFTAEDAFTGTDLNYTSRSISTDLPDDASLSVNRRVRE